MPSDMQTYRIKRFFFKGEADIVKTGLTLAEVQAHCQSLNASSRTCESEEGLQLTRDRGLWFDGYEKE